MTLTQWLSYLETLNSQTMILGLERIIEIAQRLHLTQYNCPVVTITGTNGKGSCVAYLENIFVGAGYRVGAYTSPHLLNFNERIRISSKEIEDTRLCAAFSIIETARGDVPLTYFEFTTLAALWLFQQAPLDILLLEVGLGGRLDAVNIVEADIAVITSISLDHMAWLGNTRSEIAYEKAGILRQGKQAVCGDPEPPAVIYTAAEKLGVELYCVQRDFSYTVTQNLWSWHFGKKNYLSLPIPKLPLANAATALMVLELLQFTLPVGISRVKQALRFAELPGRFQQLSYPVNTILDVAHNPAAAKLLAQRLQQEPCKGRTLAVVSILADKDIHGTLQPLLSFVDAWYVAGLAVPRGTQAQTILGHLASLEAQTCGSFSSVTDAYKQALDDYQPGDRVLVFGSFYTVAMVIKYVTSI